jgi:hypothetical protein
VRASIVLLQNKTLAASEIWHNFRLQHLVDVPLGIYTLSATSTNIFKDHWAKQTIAAHATPDHDAWAAPVVMLQDMVGVMSGVQATPDPDATICMADAKTALISKENVAPPTAVPVDMLLCPLQPLLTMSLCKHWTSSWTPALQISFSKSATYSIAADWLLIPPNCLSSSFCSTQKGLSQVLAVNPSILPWCCNAASTASCKVDRGASGFKSLA